MEIFPPNSPLYFTELLFSPDLEPVLTLIKKSSCFRNHSSTFLFPFSSFFFIFEHFFLCNFFVCLSLSNAFPSSSLVHVSLLDYPGRWQMQQTKVRKNIRLDFILFMCSLSMVSSVQVTLGLGFFYWRRMMYKDYCYFFSGCFYVLVQVSV